MNDVVRRGVEMPPAPYRNFDQAPAVRLTSRTRNNNQGFPAGTVILTNQHRNNNQIPRRKWLGCRGFRNQ